MADKNSSGGAGGIIGSGSTGYSGSGKGSSAGEKLGDKNVLIPSALPDTYLERVAAAAMPKGASKTGDKHDSGKPEKMTGENYTEIYRRQQAALGRDDFVSEEQRKKAAVAEKQRLDAARANIISNQIDAWQKTLGRDPETDKRTQATIAALARELSSLKEKG